MSRGEQERRREASDLARRFAKITSQVSSSGVRVADPDEEVVRQDPRSPAPGRRFLKRGLGDDEE